jgi:hypothetical protein
MIVLDEEDDELDEELDCEINEFDKTFAKILCDNSNGASVSFLGAWYSNVAGKLELELEELDDECESALNRECIGTQVGLGVYRTMELPACATPAKYATIGILEGLGMPIPFSPVFENILSTRPGEFTIC